jgi:hypothetical protein
MEIYRFESSTHTSVKAFTADATGANLPADYAPWAPSGKGSAVPIGRDTDPIALEIQRHGYFLLSGSPHTRGGRMVD